MSEPCKRHDFAITGYRVHVVSRGNGRALPRWAVYELGTCNRCKDTAWRELGTVRAADEREAARLCGVPEKDASALPAQTRESKAIEVPLTAWPFPCSAHDEPRPAKRRKAVRYEV